MQNVNEENSPYILFCAGEDSGDMIGAEMVASANAQGFKTIGVGGPLMQEKGLSPLWDYNELPVSGVGDVVPKYFSLKNVFDVLKDAAESKKCLGIIAIDYPGFNMKLAGFAKKWGKPMLYVAPPQVWRGNRNARESLSRLVISAWRYSLILKPKRIRRWAVKRSASNTRLQVGFMIVLSLSPICCFYREVAETVRSATCLRL